MKILRAFAALTVLTSSGCVTAPTAVQLQSADYGVVPTDYESVVHHYFDAILKDPTSIQYREVTAPEHGYVQGAPIAGGKVSYGWLVNATINAKNSYGGYVGFKTYKFLFRGNEIVDTIIPQIE